MLCKAKNIFLIAIIGWICSCRKDENIEHDFKTYLHISHTRLEDNSDINAEAKSVNYDSFDLLLLGGDLMHHSAENENTLSYLDSMFNIKDSNTLWALGNHDYPNKQLIEDYTDRPNYYACYKNGITFMILDTQDSSSNIIGSQKAFFDNVLDTISESSHLIILHHKLIWMDQYAPLEANIENSSNGNSGDCFHCLNPNNFHNDLYPQLVNIENQGIEVICIAGDIGIKISEFSYQTNEGVQFLASGISEENEENKALLLYHDEKEELVSWEYKLIREL